MDVLINIIITIVIILFVLRRMQEITKKGGDITGPPPPPPMFPEEEEEEEAEWRMETPAGKERAGRYGMSGEDSTVSGEEQQEQMRRLRENLREKYRRVAEQQRESAEERFESAGDMRYDEEYRTPVRKAEPRTARPSAKKPRKPQKRVSPVPVLSPSAVVQGIVLSEILNPPVSLRRDERL